MEIQGLFTFIGRSAKRGVTTSCHFSRKLCPTAFSNLKLADFCRFCVLEVVISSSRPSRNSWHFYLHAIVKRHWKLFIPMSESDVIVSILRSPNAPLDFLDAHFIRGLFVIIEPLAFLQIDAGEFGRSVKTVRRPFALFKFSVIAY